MKNIPIAFQEPGLETDGFFRLARREDDAWRVPRQDEQRGQAEKDAVYKPGSWKVMGIYPSPLKNTGNQ